MNHRLRNFKQINHQEMHFYFKNTVIVHMKRK